MTMSNTSESPESASQTAPKSLWPFQVEAVNNTIADLKSGLYKRVGVVIPTGGGKTFTTAEILRQISHGFRYQTTFKVVFLAHRIELINQTMKEFREAGLDVSEWSKDCKETRGKVIVTMLQSSSGLSKALRDNNNFCGMMVVDEGHHIAAQSYQNLLGELNPARVVVLTATPSRTDNLSLGIEKISFEIPFLDLVRMGHLAKPKYMLVRLAGEPDLRSDGDEFLKADIDGLNNENRNDQIAKHFLKHRAEFGKTLAFCLSVEHAYEMQRVYQKAMPDLRTAVIHGKTKDDERQDLLLAFENGSIDVMLNVDVFTEGLNVRSIQTIQLIRPTKSVVRWCQCIGRGSRIMPGKTEFTIADYAGDGNNYAFIAARWAEDILDVPMPDDMQSTTDEEEMVDKANDWLKELGSSVRLKTQEEILQVHGVLTLTQRQGKKKRLIVRRAHFKHLDKFLETFLKNPPKRDPTGQASWADTVNNYIIRYMHKDPSMRFWPGEFHMKTIGWCMANQYLSGQGQLIRYDTIPAF
jgi:superfamily II DNA or RNA helicase